MSSLVAIDVNITDGTVLSNSGLDREVALPEKQVSNKFELYYSCSAIGYNNNNDGNKIEIIFYDEELHMYDASNIFVPILEDGLKNYQIDIPHDVHKIELSFWGDYTIDYFEIYSVFNTSSVEIATETVKGIANFPDANFVVADGAISLNSSLTLNTPMSGTDKRGVSEITAEQGALTLKKWNTNNDSFEGIRLGNGVEQYDPLTDTWKSLGTSIIGGTGMVVAHADATSLTSTDLTGGNCLHVGYSTTGDKIVGDNSTIYTDGLVLLGYEVVTKELGDTTYLFNAGNEFADITGGWGASRNSSVTNNGNVLSFDMGAFNARSLFGTKNSIDVTNYKALNAIVTLTDMNANFSMALSDSFDKASGSYAAEGFILTTDPNKEHVTITIDISNITGSYYVMFAVGNWSFTTSVKGYIEKVWLGSE